MENIGGSSGQSGLKISKCEVVCNVKWTHVQLSKPCP